MQCYCCKVKIETGRMVKLRRYAQCPSPPESLMTLGAEPNPSTADFKRQQDETSRFVDSAEYKRYLENMVYRWMFICNKCYRIIDSSKIDHERIEYEVTTGLAQINGEWWNMASCSRQDKAPQVGIEHTKEGAA